MLVTFQTEMLERFNKDHLVIKKTYEEALQAGFSESSDFLRLWTEYASYLRRRIDCTLTTDVLSASKEVEELRDTFERAIIQIEKCKRRAKFEKLMQFPWKEKLLRK